MILGLRIDVDTYRGTKLGTPNLQRILSERSIEASFFFSVGPDNMGRHIWRLLKPAFLKKMLRSNAPGLYGWDILLRGTLWPGPMIGERLSDIIRSISSDGHEIGLHAWDHHAWQAHIDNMDRAMIKNALSKGFEMLERITGKPPVCSAVPAWKCNDTVLTEKESFPFTYNSDCRGDSVFYPVINGRTLNQPQIPVTIPTYDEVAGSGEITDINYNDHILSLVRPDKLNVLTIHAEVEGLACLKMFEEFIDKAIAAGVSIIPLGDLLKAPVDIGNSFLVQGEIPGREGTVAIQSRHSPKGVR